MTRKKLSAVFGIVCAATVILASMPFLAACTPDEPEPAPPSTPAVPSTPAPAPVQAVNLVISASLSPESGGGKLLKEWADNVEKFTDGQVTSTIYYSSTLLKAFESYRGLQEGVADVCDLSVGLMGLEPGSLINIMELPFMGFPSQKDGTEIFEALSDEFPEIEGGLTGVKLLTVLTMPAQQLHTTKKQVKTVEDVKGMKIIAGSWFASGLDSMGAAAINQSPTEWYMSLERGLAEGCLDAWTGVNVWKTSELFKYHSYFGDSGARMGISGVFINLDRWNSFTPEVQDTIIRASEIYVDHRVNDVDAGLIAGEVKYAEENDHVFYTFTDEEIQEWAEAFKPKHEEWIGLAEAAGLPGRAVYDETMKLIQERTGG